jgi:hypothetical protein
MSYYLHHVPGRLRLKTPFIKGDNDKAQEIRLFLKGIPGIHSTSANTVTGSLTIYYDPKEICPDSITHRLSRAGFFDRSKAITNDQYIFSIASSVLSFAAMFI